MSKFQKKRGKSSPAISTASLPDIIFMLLFFFMVTTVLREVTLKVKLDLTQASNIEKIEEKRLVSYIYICLSRRCFTILCTFYGKFYWKTSDFIKLVTYGRVCSKFSVSYFPRIFKSCIFSIYIYTICSTKSQCIYSACKICSFSRTCSSIVF